MCSCSACKSTKVAKFLLLCSGIFFASGVHKKAINKPIAPDFTDVFLLFYNVLMHPLLSVHVVGCLFLPLCPLRCPHTHSVWLQCTVAGAISHQVRGGCLLRWQIGFCTTLHRWAFKVLTLDYWTWEWKEKFHRSIKFIHFNEFNLKFVNRDQVCCAGVGYWKWIPSTFNLLPRLNSWSSPSASSMGSTWWAAHWTRL